MPDREPPTRIGGGASAGRRAPAGAAGPTRHELPAIDEAGLAAGRAADRVLAAAIAAGATRWVRYFETIPDRLRDDEPRALRQVALRARAAYGAKESLRDDLPEDVTEPLLEAIDRLIKQLNRRDAGAA
jgi:cytosine/adenosine deaminase-related metal-dependent hydrolase